MAVITGIAGSVAWAGTTNNAQLASTGSEAVSWLLDYDGDEHDTTAFAGTGAQTTYIKGLTRWAGSFESTLKTPETGTLGSVTFSAGHVVNILEHNIDIVRDSLDSTIFAATARAFTPGLCRIGGSFRGYI